MTHLAESPDISSEPPRARAGPLSGLRILDVSRVLAGPFCTMVLADLGADVIKVEDCDSGDQTRGTPPFVGDLSHYFLAINRNKRGICLNLKSEQGREAFLRLASESDVVIENFRPGVMESLGLSPTSLLAANPRLIVCSISGFGQTGPMRDVPAFDIITQALSGAMTINGPVGGEPTRLGIPLGDIGSGMWALIGILSALQHRNATGKGSAIDISMLEGLMFQLGYMSQLYWFTGQSPVSAGNGHQSVAPYGCYETKDGSIVVAVLNQRFFENFCRACEHEHLISDPRYIDPVSRNTHRVQLEEIVRSIIVTRTKTEWVAAFKKWDVPCAEVNSIGEALEQPVSVERRFIGAVNHPIYGPLRVMNNPLRFGGAFDSGTHNPPPALGEHTDEVLQWLGYTDADIRAMEEAGSIRRCARQA